MPRKPKGKAVAKREGETGLALSEYGEDAGAGFEEVTQDDLIIPFLNILQKMSPLVDEEAATYVPGAKAGMLMNSVTEELFPGQEGIVFIPVHKSHKWVEWVPRDQGGGFVGVFEPSDPMVMEARKGAAFGEVESPDGNELSETFYMFGLMVEIDGGYNPAVIAFASSQIKNYKKWMTQMRSIQLEDPDSGRRVTPPMFAHKFRIRTRHQENNKGTWHGLNITFANEGDPKKHISPAMASRLPRDSELYQAAKECRELVLEEGMRVSYETSGKGGEGGDEAADKGDDF